MESPLLSPGDRYLVVLGADSYDQAAAHYVDAYLTAVTLRSDTATSTAYHADDLRRGGGVPAIQRILAVRTCPSNSYNVAVFYSNESDRVGGRGGRGAGTGWRTVGGLHAPVSYEAEGRTDTTTVTSDGGYQHNFGFLILDVCSGIVCQVRLDARYRFVDSMQLFVRVLLLLLCCVVFLSDLNSVGECSMCSPCMGSIRLVPRFSNFSDSGTRKLAMYWSLDC